MVLSRVSAEIFYYKEQILSLDMQIWEEEEVKDGRTTHIGAEKNSEEKGAAERTSNTQTVSPRYPSHPHHLEE